VVKVQFPSYAVKGAVLLSLLTTPAYADQVLIKATRSRTIQEIAELLLTERRDTVVDTCRVAEKYNIEGFSYFDYSQSKDSIIKLSKETGNPYDITRKVVKAIHYAMRSVCPDAY
jgi:hypothetical protein